jgi:hypothetical protein
MAAPIKHLMADSDQILVYLWRVEFDANTGIAPDGTIGPTQRQHELAGEVLRLQEHLTALEAEQAGLSKAGDNEGVRRVAESILVGYRKLAEIQRQRREERTRKNPALGYE